MVKPHGLVVIGASAGGVGPLLSLAAQLPANFDGSIVIVLHIDAYDSHIPESMNLRGKLATSYAVGGETIERARIYFAPPDHHLLLEGTTMRLLQGPKENFTRPAIDPLFRSAALTWTGPLIGVILSGMLDDGAAGLRAIGRRGGITIVQDPGDADMPSMPRAALAAVDVDHRVRSADLGALLVRLLEAPMPRPSHGDTSIDADELALSLSAAEPFTTLDRIGIRSSVTCPDCGGPLWELRNQSPRRFRCHTGHAFTLRALEYAQSHVSSGAVATTLRALVEKRYLLNELANSYGPDAEPGSVAMTKKQLERIDQAIATLHDLTETLPGSITRLLPDEPTS